MDETNLDTRLGTRKRENYGSGTETTIREQYASELYEAVRKKRSTHTFRNRSVVVKMYL